MRYELHIDGELAFSSRQYGPLKKRAKKQNKPWVLYKIVVPRMKGRPIKYEYLSHNDIENIRLLRDQQNTYENIAKLFGISERQLFYSIADYVKFYKVKLDFKELKLKK